MFLLNIGEIKFNIASATVKSIDGDNSLQKKLTKIIIHIKIIPTLEIQIKFNL